MADQIEGRNPIVECLVRKRRGVHQIWLDQEREDRCTSRPIALLAEAAQVKVKRVERRWLDQRRKDVYTTG